MLPWLDMVPKSVLGAPGGDVGLEPPELVPLPLRPCRWRQQIILEQHHTATHTFVDQRYHLVIVAVTCSLTRKTISILFSITVWGRFYYNAVPVHAFIHFMQGVGQCLRSELHLRDGLAPWLEQGYVARAEGALDAGVQGSQRVSDAVQGPHCATHSLTPGCCREAALIPLKQGLNGAHVTWHWHTLHSIMILAMHSRSQYMHSLCTIVWSRQGCSFWPHASLKTYTRGTSHSGIRVPADEVFVTA